MSSINTTPQYPHCNQYTLHKRGECNFCDKFPALQFKRVLENIPFDLMEATSKNDSPALVINNPWAQTISISYEIVSGSSVGYVGADTAVEQAFSKLTSPKIDWNTKGFQADQAAALQEAFEKLFKFK